MPGSITLRNITRPEAAGFAVGDAALVSITGATANGEVTNTATLNGNPLGTTVYGQTNSFGEFYLVRTFGASDAGDWVEIWKVDGVQVGSTLTFTCAASAALLVEDTVFDIVQEDWIDAYDLVPDAEEDVDFDCTYSVPPDVTKYGVGTAVFLGMGHLVKRGIGWNLCTAALGDTAIHRRRNTVRSY